MPVVQVIPEDKFIAVNGVGFEFPDGFPHEDNLRLLEWTGDEHSGQGILMFTDDYDMALLPQLYKEEVVPYIAFWQAEKVRREEAMKQQEAENQKYFASDTYKFRQLREIRKLKLAAYDTAKNQLERIIRLAPANSDTATKASSLLYDWDMYAEKLSNMTEWEGAPWDGGVAPDNPNAIPWPEEPPAPKTLQN